MCPSLSALPGLTSTCATRDQVTLDRLGDARRIEHRYHLGGRGARRGRRGGLRAPATSAHVKIVEPLLQAGVHVYLDKPIAYTLAESEALVRLARERGGRCSSGSTRKAPSYAACLDLPRGLVVMEKNRRDLPEDPRTTIFDDSSRSWTRSGSWCPARSSTPDPDPGQERPAGALTLELSGDGFAASGIMSGISGAAEETRWR